MAGPGGRHTGAVDYRRRYQAIVFARLLTVPTRSVSVIAFLSAGRGRT
jgi:hypothetical protein